jgi:hypothetical protein
MAETSLNLKECSYCLNWYNKYYLEKHQRFHCGLNPNYLPKRFRDSVRTLKYNLEEKIKLLKKANNSLRNRIKRKNEMLYFFSFLIIFLIILIFL